MDTPSVMGRVPITASSRAFPRLLTYTLSPAFRGALRSKGRKPLASASSTADRTASRSVLERSKKARYPSQYRSAAASPSSLSRTVAGLGS